MEQPFFLLISAMGSFAMMGGIMDWEWFMNSRKGRRMVRLIGRRGARILYVCLGLFLIVLGVLMAVGILDPSRPA